MPRHLGLISPNSPNARKFVTARHLHETSSCRHEAGPGYVISYVNNVQVWILDDGRLEIYEESMRGTQAGPQTSWQKRFEGLHNLDLGSKNPTEAEVNKRHAVARVAFVKMQRLMRAYTLERNGMFCGFPMDMETAIGFILQSLPVSEKESQDPIGLYMALDGVCVGAVSVANHTKVIYHTQIEMIERRAIATERGKILKDLFVGTQREIPWTLMQSEWVNQTYLDVRKGAAPQSAREKMIFDEIDTYIRKNRFR